MWRKKDKHIKYLNDRITQSAVNGDVDEFIELSRKLGNSVSYTKCLYYALKHTRPEMIEYLISKIDGEIPDYFSYRGRSNLGTNRLLNLINLIDDEDINTERLSKYREHIVLCFVRESFSKYYTDKLLNGLDLMRDEEVSENILRESMKDLSNTSSSNGQNFYDSLVPLIRERSINNLMKN